MTAWAWSRYGRRVFGKGDLLLVLLISLGLMLLSIAPKLVSDVSARLVGPMAGYRLVLLLLLAVFLLFMLWLRQTARITGQERRLVGLMDALTARHFVETHPRLEVEGQVLAVIPAYNEAEAIGGVLADMPRTCAGLKVQPLVVDDASRDETAEVVKNLGVPVVSNPINRGGGGALRVGYRPGPGPGRGGGGDPGRRRPAPARPDGAPGETHRGRPGRPGGGQPHPGRQRGRRGHPAGRHLLLQPPGLPAADAQGHRLLQRIQGHPHQVAGPAATHPGAVPHHRFS